MQIYFIILVFLYILIVLSYSGQKFGCRRLVKMNKQQFLLHFLKKEKVSDPQNNDFRITNVLTSTKNDITKAELTLVEDKIQKSCSSTWQIPNSCIWKIKKEVGTSVTIYGTASTIKKFSTKYKKIYFQSNKHSTTRRLNASAITLFSPRLE